MTEETTGDAGSKTNDSRKELLAELKEQNTRDLGLRETLDNKADKMIAMASAFATLLITLGTFLVSRIDVGNTIFFLDIVILFFGLVFAGLSIAFSINAFKVRTFDFPFGPDTYVKNEKVKGVKRKFLLWRGKDTKTTYLEDDAKKVWEKTKDQFSEIAIGVYILAMNRNAEKLDIKAKFIGFSQRFFLASVISVSIVLLVTLVGVGSGYISFANIETKNQIPISDAGSDQIMTENGTVILDGTGSHDPDGNVTSYRWRQIFGVPVNLKDEKSAITTFRAPNVANTTTLKFKLLVNDTKNVTSSDTVNIVVNNGTMQTNGNSSVLLCNRSEASFMPSLLSIANNTTRQQELEKFLCQRRVDFDPATNSALMSHSS